MNKAEQQLIRLGFGFAVSQALRVAADLEIADRLAAGASDVTTLADQTGANADALYRIMRVLAAEGVFREALPQQFELTELGHALRTTAHAGPRDLIRMINREPYLAFAQLGRSVSTG